MRKYKHIFSLRKYTFSTKGLLTLINPNKAGFFEGNSAWEGGGINLTPPSYFKKNLSNISITLYNCWTIYLKYVESDKILAWSVISWFISFFVTR